MFCEENINECLEISPCQHNASCMDLDPGYKCSCVAGYLGSKCHLEDPCYNKSYCHNNGSCKVNLVEDNAAAASCNCSVGWTGTRCEMVSSYTT